MNDRAGVLTSRHAIRTAIEGGASGTLYVARKNPKVEDLISVAQKNHIEVRYVTNEKVKKIGGPAVRGAVFETSSKVRRTDARWELKDWLTENVNDLPSPVIALDHITDPHNLGAIMRSAHWFDVPLIIIPERRSATGGDVVARASAGAVSLVHRSHVTNLRSALELCKSAGYWIYGADAKGEVLGDISVNQPTLIVLGAEGPGLSPGIVKTIDQLVRIPRYGTSNSSVDSLNVSVSAGVLLYGIRESLRNEPVR